MHALPSRLLALLIGSLLPLSCLAEVDAPAGSAAPLARPAGDDEVRIKEIFSTHLPGTMKAYAFRLWLHPHLGDFESKDFLRVSGGIRYGVTNRWELSAGGDLYFSHGLGDVGFFQRTGVANLQLGSKWNIGQTLLPGWESAVGLDLTTPVGSPPTDLTDGLRHVSPYVTFSQRQKNLPALRLFWGLGVDCVRHTSTPGEVKSNDLGDSANSLTLGAVLDQGRLHYSLEAITASTRLLGHSDRDSFTLRPGIVWEVPPRGGRPGRGSWMIGTSLRATEGPDGFSLGVSLKLRANLDLKRLLRRRAGL
jgi:hypothetical protein